MTFENHKIAQKSKVNEAKWGERESVLRQDVSAIKTRMDTKRSQWQNGQVCFIFNLDKIW